MSSILGKFVRQINTKNGVDYYFENYLIIHANEFNGNVISCYPFSKSAGEYEDVPFLKHEPTVTNAFVAWLHEHPTIYMRYNEEEELTV